ncbi:MAG: methyltransferase domain-containing protein [Actinomycetia bacterium]|nr:methyltransferase domain-containing protein [Actinomycetes bacterium]
MSDHGEHRHHEHGHGHAHDQGLSGMLRYLRYAPEMWRSEINDAVVDLVVPQPGERVLDIGAGMGAGTAVAADGGATVVAVEPTPFMRRVLTVRRLARRSRSRIEIEAGAAEQLPAAAASIDAVWAVNTMHHWIDPERGAAEIGRVLRPGGRVVLVDENFTDPDHPDYENFGSRQADDDGHHHGFTMVDAAEMGDWLRLVGLVGVEAAERRVAERPSIVVTGRAAG